MLAYVADSLSKKAGKPGPTLGEEEALNQSVFTPASHRWDRGAKLLIVIGLGVLFAALGLGWSDRWSYQWEEVWEWLLDPWMVGVLLLTLCLRFGEMAWRFYLLCVYRQAPLQADEDLPLVTVVVPAYNEGQQVLRSLRSVAASDYPAERLQIIAVDDGSQDDTWLWMQRAEVELGSRITLVRMPKNQGKRAALHAGFARATGQVLVTIDSDSEVEPITLRYLVAPFADPKVGAVAGNVRVLNREQGLIPRMLDVNFTYSFDFIRAGQSRFNTVFCTPGALSAYRRSVVEPVQDQWRDQRFLGRPANIGEDRALTNLILRQGYHVHFAAKAKVYTMAPVAYKGLCRMFLRWARSNVRESLVMTSFAFRRFRQASALGMRVNLLLSLYAMTAGELLKLYAFYLILTGPSVILLNVVMGAALSAIVPALIHYWRYRNSDLLWAFPYAVFNALALSWISLYAVFTPQRSSWLTRQLEPGDARSAAGPLALPVK